MCNLPSAFISYTRSLFGEDLWQKYLASFNESTPVSIRLAKHTDISSLAHLPISGRIPWSAQGYYLYERPVFTLDPLLHAGAYYVQEASSQYLNEVLRIVTKNLDIQLAADFCASPGGKSLIIKDFLPSTATLISNEFVRKRAWILAENIEKSFLATLSTNSDSPKIIVTNNSTEEIAHSGNIFDLILCDVPCSGEGMFRKDHATMDEWNLDNVMKCAKLQREIVCNAWECLREGGVIVSST